MAEAALERLKLPATLIASFAALFVAFDLFILLLNVLGYDISLLNQASTVVRRGRGVRVPGMGLRGVSLYAANTGFLLGHVVMLGLALKLRSAPSRGWATVTASYALIPCLCPCVFFPLGVWLMSLGSRVRPSLPGG